MDDLVGDAPNQVTRQGSLQRSGGLRGGVQADGVSLILPRRPSYVLEMGPIPREFFPTWYPGAAPICGPLGATVPAHVLQLALMIVRGRHTGRDYGN